MLLAPEKSTKAIMRGNSDPHPNNYMIAVVAGHCSPGSSDVVRRTFMDERMQSRCLVMPDVIGVQCHSAPQ